MLAELKEFRIGNRWLSNSKIKQPTSDMMSKYSIVKDSNADLTVENWNSKKGPLLLMQKKNLGILVQTFDSGPILDNWENNP